MLFYLIFILTIQKLGEDRPLFVPMDTYVKYNTTLYFKPQTFVTISHDGSCNKNVCIIILTLKKLFGSRPTLKNFLVIKSIIKLVQSTRWYGDFSGIYLYLF